MLQINRFFILILLCSQIAFRTGTSTRLDDRVMAMCLMKTLPLDQLIRYIYPDMYLLDPLFSDNYGNEKHVDRSEPPKLQLSAERYVMKIIK